MMYLRLALSALLLLAAAACGGSSLSGQPDGGEGKGPVRVGLVVAQSGVFASIGRDMQDAFQLYVDQHRGRLGGRKTELVVVDEGEGPQTGVPAATKLVRQDRVHAAVGVVNSAVALGVRSLFTEAKTPLIVSNAGADAITGTQGSEFLWRTSFANSEISGSIGSYVAGKEASGSVYLLGPDYAAGKEHLGGFRKAFEGAGGKVAGQQFTPFGKTQDFQPYLSAVKKSGAKAVFAFYAGAEAVTFVKQYKQFGLAGTVPLYSAGFLTEGPALQAQGDAAIGIKNTLNYAPGLTNAANARFAPAYRTKTGRAPTTYAMATYDAAAVLDRALATAPGPVTGETIAGALARVGEIDSPRGAWRFGGNRNPVQKYYLREVRRAAGGLDNVVVRELPG